MPTTAAHNQFAWQSGELHILKNATSVPLDTRYITILPKTIDEKSLKIFFFSFAEIIKRPIKMKLRLCQRIAPVPVQVILNKIEKKVIKRPILFSINSTIVFILRLFYFLFIWCN